MEPWIPVLLSSIACGLASVCVVLSLWSFVRLSRVEVKNADLDEKLPQKRVRELEQAFDAMTDAFEAHQQSNAAWKQSVHNSVQRMDQIMRKNKEATGRVLEPDGSLNQDVVKGELPEGMPLLDPDPVTLGKQAALRLRYNRNRNIGT